MLWPLTDAATYIAPALTAGKPVFFIIGIVNVPVVKKFAMDEPLIIPVNPEAKIDAFAGPPLNLPTKAKARLRKYLPPPA